VGVAVEFADALAILVVNLSTKPANRTKVAKTEHAKSNQSNTFSANDNLR